MNTAPYVPGSETSKAAAQSVSGRTESMRDVIYRAIASASQAPTRNDLIERTGLLRNCVSPRLQELIDEGRVKVGPMRDGFHTYELGRGGPRVSGSTPQPAEFVKAGDPAEGLETEIMVVLRAARSNADRCDDAIFRALGLPETERHRVTFARISLVRKGCIVKGRYKTKTSSGVQATAWLPIGSAETPERLRQYDSTERYAAGDMIQHGAYGIGIVSSVDIDGSGITVDFGGIERELSCARAAA